MDNLTMFSLIVLISCQAIPLAYACFSSGSPAPTPAPTPPPNNMQCTANEKVCLHGGTCIKRIIGGNAVYSCQCAEGWIGDECETKKPDLLQMSSATSPGAIAGIVIAVILVFLLVAAVFFLALRKKRKSDKPKLEDPYTFSPSNKDDITRSKADNFAVGRHMQNTKAPNPTFHVTSLPPQHPGHRNKGFESNSPTKQQSTKKTDNTDNPRINSILSNTSRPPSNTGSVFHHNTSTLSSASNCPVAHHESTV